MPFDPDTDAILTFYKAQRDLIKRQLPTGSPCQIIDSSQGFVVEGLAGRANKLSILFLPPLDTSGIHPKYLLNQVDVVYICT